MVTSSSGNEMTFKQKAVLSVVMFIPFFTLIYNWFALRSGCFHALDLGIYQQAILDLAFSPSWNPENTLRGIHIFADHFDPITLLAAAFQRIVGPYPWVPLIVEFLFYWFGGWVILLLFKRERFEWLILVLMLWFFNEGIAVATRYPVHPTTWSALLTLLVVGAFKKEKFTWAILSLNALCLFKEYFPFCFLMYAVFNLGRKKWRNGIIALLNAIIWLVFDFYLRSKIFPDVYNYGGWLVSGVLADPLGGLWKAFVQFEWKGVFLSTFPVLILYPLIFKNELKRSWLLMSFLFILPILGIQFLYGSMRHQHAAPVFGVFVGVVVWANSNWMVKPDKLTRWIKCAAFIMMIYAGGDLITKSMTIFIPKENHCRYDRTKVSEFQAARNYIGALPKNIKIIASGGLVPVIIAPNQHLYQYGMFSKRQDAYDVLVFGRHGTSDQYAFSAERFEEVIERCRPFATDIVMDTYNVFVAKGKFTENCLQQP